MRRSIGLLVLTLFLLSTWTTACVETRVVSKPQLLEVKTDPPGAQVWVKDETGKKLVGVSPRQVEIDYQVETESFNKWLWSTVAVSALGVGFGGALTYVGADEKSGGDNEDYAGPLYGGIAWLGLSTIGLVVSLVYSLKGEARDGQQRPIARTVTVGADLPLHESGSLELEIPRVSTTVDLRLKPAPIVSSERVIVAVFDLQDGSNKIAPETIVQLTSYLGTLLAQYGAYRVVPREQLRQRLLQEKLGTYQSCFDEGCQIELGKAVAAQKSLATSLIRVGEKCALTANLVDLKTETLERGASVETGCSDSELLGAMKKIAQQLAK
jgi:hypothetical protein